jgi:hypothetical protein
VSRRSFESSTRRTGSRRSGLQGLRQPPVNLGEERRGEATLSRYARRRRTPSTSRDIPRALAGHVCDDHADLAFGQIEHVVVIAADLRRGPVMSLDDERAARVVPFGKRDVWILFASSIS